MMDKPLNLIDMDLTDAEFRYGFVNVQSKTYILLELPVHSFGLYIAQAIEADSSLNGKLTAVRLCWNCMDDFNEGKEPSQILNQIQ